MSKRSSYIIIVLLVMVVLYLLFTPQDTAETPTVVPDAAEPIDEAAAETDVIEEGVEAKAITEEKTATIEFSGTLVGFSDGKDQFLGSYKNVLINDGIEVLEIDLRPVIGYDVTNLESDLGVTVGTEVSVEGNMEDGEFVLSRIRSATVGE